MTRSILLAILFALVLTGCGTVASALPSVQNCQHVSYNRDYSHVTMSFDCDTAQSGTIEIPQ